MFAACVLPLYQVCKTHVRQQLACALCICVHAHKCIRVPVVVFYSDACVFVCVNKCALKNAYLHM